MAGFRRGLERGFRPEARRGLNPNPAEMDMSHHASGNWKNIRKEPMKGIQTGPRPANRNQVRVLLSGTVDEALGFVKRHAENGSFLSIAEELEAARKPARPAVLKLIRNQIASLATP